MRKSRNIINASIADLSVNIFLTAFKLTAGLLASSSAMLADAVHSLTDVCGSLVLIIGSVFSCRDSDDCHPYGHEKLECVASAVVGIILTAAGIGIGLNAVNTILSGGEALAVPGAFALVAAAVSILIKELMYHYMMRRAKKLRSVSLKAEAWHNRSDAMASLGGFVGILGARLGFPLLDPVAGLLICLFIFRAAYSIFRESIDRLVDHSCDPETISRMKNTLDNVEGVVRVDDLKTRLFGSRIYVDAEISVDGSLSIMDAHDIAHRAHDLIENQFPVVKHCTVHVNPD